MMAHYQNTERLQALLKKHQSENSLVSLLPGVKLWESTLWRLAENNSWMHTTLRWKSTIADLYTITLTRRHQFYTPQWSDIQYFLLLALLTIKRWRKCCWLGSHMNQHLRLVPIIALRHPPDLRLSASQRSRQLNYWGRQSSSIDKPTDAQLPTGLSKGHKRPDLRPLAACGSSEKAPRGLIFLCVSRTKQQLKKKICPLNSVSYFRGTMKGTALKCLI